MILYVSVCLHQNPEADYVLVVHFLQGTPDFDLLIHPRFPILMPPHPSVESLLPSEAAEASEDREAKELLDDGIDANNDTRMDIEPADPPTITQYSTTAETVNDADDPSSINHLDPAVEKQDLGQPGEKVNSPSPPPAQPLEPATQPTTMTALTTVQMISDPPEKVDDEDDEEDDELPTINMDSDSE